MAAVARLLIVLATGYLALCLLLYLIQNWLIFHLRPLHAAPAGPHVEELVLERDDDVRLHGWLVNGNAPGPLVVYFGGNAEELSALTDVFARLPASTVLMNYRGFGASGGRPDVAALISDARAVVEYARQRYGRGRPLVLFGRSLGTGFAATAAAAAPVDGLILLSPYLSLERLARRLFPFLPVRWLLRHPLDLTVHVEQLPARVLVLYGLDDLVIPAAESQRLASLLRPPPQTVTFNADHNVPLTHPALWPHLVQFLGD